MHDIGMDDRTGRTAVHETDEAPAKTALLSVCIPTYKRAEGLRRALSSVTSASFPARERVEIIVSDNGGAEAAVSAAGSYLDAWPGPTRHVVHDPPVGMVGNFNACWKLARGEWVFILHDDDYLIGSGLEGLVGAAATAGPDEHVLVLGVDVVDEHGRRRRRQVSRRREQLDPARAVEWLVSDSSSVRFPAMMVRRSSYERADGFDADMANMTDYDMWLRLFARFGATRVPDVTSAYVVHSQAATEAVFSPFGVRLLEELFRRVAATDLISESRLPSLKRDYLHKFLLAGTFRRLQRRQWCQAYETFSLLRHEPVARLGWSPRWAPVRLAAQLLFAAPGPWASSRKPIHD